MAATINVVEGINILLKYCDGDLKDSYNLTAEHNVIYFTDFPSHKVTEDDRNKLVQLGWIMDSCYESHSGYDVGDSWMMLL